MRPELEAVSARIVDINLQGVELAIDVDIRNNAFIGLNTPSGRYAVDVADARLVSSDTIPPATLPAGGVGTVTLPARIAYADLWQLYQNAKDAAEVPYRVEGALGFSVFDQLVEIPFDHEGKLPVLRVPRIRVTKLETSGLSLSGAEVHARGLISNPNVFALGISKLGYSFMLGEVNIGSVQVTTDDMIEPGSSGELSFSCKLSAKDAAKSLMGGAKIGMAKLIGTGELKTPYGSVRLPGD